MVEGNMLGTSLFYGRGAGKLPTASAVCSDILDAATTSADSAKQTSWVAAADGEFLTADMIKSVRCAIVKSGSAAEKRADESGMFAKKCTAGKLTAFITKAPVTEKELEFIDEGLVKVYNVLA
jgi:homoserine dehydrogenase